MLTTRSVVSISSVAMMLLGTDGVSSQTYPNKPIRLVTSTAGGGIDVMARIIVQGIGGPLGQQVIVDNRSSGVVPAEIVSKAPPDGYTVLFAGSAFLIGPLLQKLPYDVVRDFAPVILTGQNPNVVVVHPSVPVKSVQGLIALAKAKPGGLNYGAGPAGSSTHLAPELLKSMAGVDIVNIPYKGGGAAVIGLMAGEIQLMITSPPSVMPFINSGKLRALAVTSLQPSALVPGVPTVAASGLPGYEFIGIDALLAPAHTPPAIIKRLNQEVVRFLKTTEAKEKFFNQGVEVVASSPEELGNKIKSEIAKWGKVIKDAGFRIE